MRKTYSFWEPDETLYLIDQYNAGVMIAPIAIELGRNIGSLSRKLDDLAVRGTVTRRDNTHIGLRAVIRRFEPPTREYNECLYLTGDAMSLSDSHLPYHSESVFAHAIAIGKKYLKKPRQLILNGDFLNLDGFSKYVTGYRGLKNTMQELNCATRMLKRLLETFDKIYWSQGNHEDRLLTQLGGSITASTFLKMITTAEIERHVIFSDYPYVILNDTWRITHPKNYSGRGGQVPSAIADINDMNVVGGHTHAWGMQTSVNGKHLAIDQGLSADPVKLEYHAKGETTNRAWNQGFTLYLNNHAYLFSERFTDWNFWLKKVSLKKEPRRK